jgi:hypothetical protein
MLIINNNDKRPCILPGFVLRIFTNGDTYICFGRNKAI